MTSDRRVETGARSLIDVPTEAALFRKQRWQIWLATIRGLLQESFLRILLITTLTVVFWVMMFGLFYEGFSLLTTTISHPPTLARTVHAVYNVFFLSLLLMLGVSSAILFYAAIYKSPEISLLLTLPARPGRIVHDKFIESTLLACWGFLLLGSPLLVAYGIVNHSPAAYFVLLPTLLISFSVIPAGLGAIACMLLVAIAPRLRQLVLGTLLVGMVIAAGYATWSVLGGVSPETLSGLWLQQALAKLKVAEQRMLPSWWLSTALLDAAHGGPRGVLQALGLQCVLLSNALLIPRIVSFIGDKTLRKSYGQLRQASRQGQPWRMQIVDVITHRLLRAFNPTVQLVLAKDLRLFRRDPLQWSQFILFFGLLSFYFIYVRRFDYGNQLTGWMTAIGFMNLGVVGLILSAFTTRFVFPLVSMEGQRFWILGTAPIDRRDVLWSKFIFAVLITGLPCCSLVFLSDVALELVQRTPAMAFIHQIICLGLSIGLSAISVGLGARLPNLKETSPAKIAAGYGGTLTLIVSAVFVIAMIVPPAVPAYLVYADYDLTPLQLPIPGTPRHWFLAGMVLSAVVSGLAVWLPMRSGFRAFRRLELK